MNEVDACPTGADLGGIVEQPGALSPQMLTEGVHVVSAQAHLLQAGALLVDELRDGGSLIKGSEQLDHAAPIAQVLRADHSFDDALFFIGFLVVVHPAHVAAVPLDCCVQVRHRDADVVEASDVLVGDVDV